MEETAREPTVSRRAFKSEPDCRFVRSGRHTLLGELPFAVISRRPSVLVRDEQRLLSLRKSLLTPSSTSVGEDDEDAKETFWEKFMPEDGAGIVSNVMAGMIAGVKICIGMVVFASLTWTQNKDLAGALPMGVKMNLLACSVLMSSYLFFGQINFGMVLVQDIPALLLGKMSLDLTHLLHDPREFVPTMILLINMQAICSGLLFFLAYSLNWAPVVQQVPQAVVGGFISACGFNLWRAALAKLTNVQWASDGFWPVTWEPVVKPSNLALLVAGFGSFLFLVTFPAWIKRKVKNRYLMSLAGPIAMLTPIVAFYLVAIGCLGYTMDELREVGWLEKDTSSDSTSSGQVQVWDFWAQVYDFQHMNLQVLPHFAPHLASTAMLSLLEAVFNVAGIDAAAPQRHGLLDVGDELWSFGIGNIVSGLLGGGTGYLQGGMTLNAWRVDGATHKLCEVCAACFTLFVFFSGVSISPYVPKFTLGGIFLMVGYFFNETWLWKARCSFSRSEYCAMLMTIVVSLHCGMAMAMLWGFCCAAVIFIAQSAQINPIKEVYRASDKPSRKTETSRPESERAILRRKGHLIMITELRGFLFWGTARQVIDAYVSIETTKLGRPLYLIIDLDEVPRVDISAVKAFEKCLRLATSRGCRVAFSSATQCTAAILNQGQILGTQSVGPFGKSTKAIGVKCEYFNTLEDAVVAFEDDLVLREQLRTEPKPQAPCACSSGPCSSGPCSSAEPEAEA